MKKIIALFLVLISATAFACGKKPGEIIFAEVYDKETGVYYATDYRRGVGTYHDVMSDEPKVDFTLQEGEAGQVTATAIFEVNGVKKTIHLSGRVNAIYRCLMSPGRVRWADRERIPANHEETFRKYMEETLSK